MAAKSGAIVLVLLALLLLAACGDQDEDASWSIMTHDSFDIGEDVIAEFEAANDATVVIQEAGDAGQALVRAILEKGNPSADLLYGIDNTYLGRALDEGDLRSLRVRQPPRRLGSSHPGRDTTLRPSTTATSTSTLTRRTWKRPEWRPPQPWRS